MTAVFSSTIACRTAWRNVPSLVAAVLTMLTWLVQPAWSQTPTTDEQPILYRRVHVPVDKLDSWPRQDEKYFPIEVTELDRLLEASRRATDAETHQPRVVRGRYSATVEEDHLLVGEATLDVQADREPGLLVLDGVNIEIVEAAWEDQPPRPARLGNWHRADGNSIFGLEVPASGRLRLVWRGHAAAQSGNSAFYNLRFPVGLQQQLRLDVPEDHEAVVTDGGLPLPAEDAPIDELPPVQRSTQRTAIGLSNAAPLQLRVSRAKESELATPTVGVIDERAVYRLTNRGLDVELTLQTSDTAPLGNVIAIEIDPELQIVAVRSGEAELPWSIRKDDPNVPYDAFVRLPPASAGQRREIVVEAWGKLEIDQPWRLPALRAPENLWRSRELTLRVPHDLELTQLIPRDYLQTAVAPGDPATGPASYRFAAATPTASLLVQVRPREAATRAVVVHAAEVGVPEIEGQLAATLTVDSGAVHSVRAALTRGWTLDDISTWPASALGDWRVETTSQGQVAVVDLAQAARAKRPVQILFRGRRRHTVGEDLISTSTLRMLTLVDVAIEKEFWIARAGDPIQITLQDSPRRLSREDLPAAEALPLAVEAGDLLWQTTSEGDDVTLDVRQQQPIVDAEIDQRFVLRDEEIRSQNTFHLRPREGEAACYHIYFNHPLSDRAKWIDLADGTQVSAERLTQPSDWPHQLPPSSGSANAAAAGQVWRICPRGPVGQTQRIRVVDERPGADSPHLPLACVVEAADQTAQVSVRFSSDAAVEFSTHGLTPTVRAEAAPASPGQQVRRFRYHAAHLLSLQRKVALNVTPAAAPQDDAREAYARRADWTSSYFADGTEIHQGRLEVRAVGSDLRLAIPQQARCEWLRVDDTAWPLAMNQGSPNEWNIALAAGHDWNTIELQFVVEGPPLAEHRRLLPPALPTGPAVWSGTWSVLVPAGFVAATPDQPDLGIRQRLLGPLARPATRQSAPWWAAGGLSLTPVAAGEPSAAGTADGHPTRRGWSTWSTTFGPTGPQEIAVLRPQRQCTLALLQTLVWAAVGLAVARVGWCLLGTGAGVAAVLALVLPAGWSLLATHALLGMLIALAYAATIGSQRVNGGRRAPSSARTVIGRLLALLILAAAVGVSVTGTLWADAPDDSGELRPAGVSEAADQVHAILVPTDEKGRSAGSKRFVSARLLEALTRHAQSRQSPLGRWLIRSAHYRGELDEPNSAEQPIFKGWTLEYDVEVFARNTQLRLPLVREEGNWSETVSVDGIATPLEWDQDGRSCSFLISEPGRYQAVLDCRLDADSQPQRSSPPLRVPPLQRATMEIVNPHGLGDVTIQGALHTIQDDDGNIVASLKSVDRLVVSWGARTPLEAAGRDEIDELLWYRLAADEVTLEARYVWPPGSMPPDMLELAVDKRLELLEEEDVVNGPLWDITWGDDEQLQVRPHPDAEPTAWQAGLRLQFRVADVPRFGRFQLPMPVAVKNKSGRRRLALSAAAALNVSSLPSQDVARATLEEFSDAWPDSAELPQEVVVVDPLVDAWPVEVRPRDPGPAVDQWLAIIAEREEVELRYVASVTPGTQDRFAHRLNIPADLEIDEVSTDRWGQVRWTRPQPDQLQVFFPAALSEPLQLQVAGAMKLPLSGKLALPRIASAESNSAKRLVSLYRHDDTHVELSPSPAPIQPTGEAIAGLETDRARLVGHFELNADATSEVELVVATNLVEMTADSITTLQHENDRWLVSWATRIQVERGTLGILRLEVSDSWHGPFQSQPAVEISGRRQVTADERGGQGGRELLVRLAEPVGQGETFRLEITAPLESTSLQLIDVPNVDLKGALEKSRYIVLPAEVAGQPYTWTGVGVHGALGASKNLLAAVVSPVATHTLEVREDPYRVQLQSALNQKPLPEIDLAEMTVLDGGRAGALIAANFLLATGDRDDWVVQVPPDFELVDVIWGGARPLFRRETADRWRLTLGPSEAPRVLQLIAKGPNGHTEATGEQQFLRPTLWVDDQPIEVQLTLWSLNSRRQRGPSQAVNAARIVPAERSLLKLQRLYSALREASSRSPAAESSEPAWIVRRAQLVAARQQAAHDLAASDDPSAAAVVPGGPSAAERFAQVSEQIDELLARLEPSTSFPDDDQETPLDELPTASLAETLPGRWEHFLAEKTSDRLVIQQAVAYRWAPIVLYFTAALLAALVYVASTARGRAALADAFWRWPHGFAVALGLAWWCWCWPGGLGLVIAVASLWPLAQRRSAARRPTGEGSTAIRLADSAFLVQQ